MCIKYAFLIKQLLYISIFKAKYLYAIDLCCIFAIQEKG